jgi:hypothetical protein
MIEVEYQDKAGLVALENLSIGAVFDLPFKEQVADVGAGDDGLGAEGWVRVSAGSVYDNAIGENIPILHLKWLVVSSLKPSAKVLLRGVVTKIAVSSRKGADK